MDLVIDASAILAVLLCEPQREALIAVTSSAELLTPGSTPWEIGNALVAGWRRKRLTPAQMAAAWSSFQAVPLRLVEVDVPRALSYSEARQQFAALLDEARRAGRVQIRRRDGQLFVLQPATQEGSPLDVPGVAAGLLAGESAAWLREEREAAGDRLLEAASGAPANSSSTGPLR